MRPRPAARHALAALVLVSSALLVSPSSALAITWGPIRDLAPGPSYTRSPVIAGTGLARAVVAFRSGPDEIGESEPPYGIWVVRTGDSGGTWSDPVLVGGNSSSEPRLAAYGPKVDLVWTQNGRVFYRRSADGGKTWATQRTLSPPGVEAVGADVTRASTGQVTVTWSDAESRELRVRTSLDGGATYQPSRRLRVTTSDDIPLGGRLATAAGVTYIAFFVGPSKIVSRRSTDAGASWQAARVVARDSAPREVDVASGGTAVILTYTRQEAATQRAVYRRSADQGLTWSLAAPLSPTAESWSAMPTIDTRGGTWIATWQRAPSSPGDWVDLAVMHRSSRDSGRTWSTVSRVGPVPTSYGIFEYEYPGEATLAGKQIVVFEGFHIGGASGIHQAFVRAGG